MNADEICAAVQQLDQDAYAAGVISRDPEVADLKRQILLLQNRPPPTPDPEPAPEPPSTSTKFPVGISTSAKGNRGGLATGWPAYRAYVPGSCPSNVTSVSDVRVALDDSALRYIFLSWKDTNQAQVKAMLTSAAKLAQAEGITIDCGYFHEMEDNMPGSQYLPVAKAHRAIAQSVGLKFGPMYQAWTFNPKAGRNWRDWWDPACDLLGIEAYNPGRKRTPPVFEPPGEFLDRAFVALKEAGKPTAIGEFGMPVHPTDPSVRPAYIKSIINYYRDKCPVPVRGAMYWDSVITNDNRLDRAAAEALQSMNAAP